MIFKIYGERNSGTNFLNKLLNINLGYSFEDHIDLNTSKAYFWKHGIPCSKFKKAHSRVIDVFIVRSIKNWLISTFHNPYCLSFNNPIEEIQDFLVHKHSTEKVCNLTLSNENKLKSIAKWLINNLTINSDTQSIQNESVRSFIHHLVMRDRRRSIFPTNHLREFISNKHLNYDDDNRNIFEIRIHKIRSYLQYIKEHKDTVIVKLDFIQKKENCKLFIDELSRKLSISNYHYNPIPRNLKTYSKKLSTNYKTNIDLYQDIIASHCDRELELYVEKLSWDIRI
jgi:hypothetical protein